jgi:integrase
MQKRMEKPKKTVKKDSEGWPREVQPGRTIVRVYRRKTPSGNWAFMVANYAENGKRRFDSYQDEDTAIDAATSLAKRLDDCNYVAASLTKDQAMEYATGAKRLECFGVSVDKATSLVADLLSDKPGEPIDKIREAWKFFWTMHRPITEKLLKEVIDEFLAVKKARKASPRYLKDLDSRLGRFAESFNVNTNNIGTAEIQEWLDGLKLEPQGYKNYRTVLNTFFGHAVSRNYAVTNPVEGLDKAKVNNGVDIEIFTPEQMGRLMAAASPKFKPCLAIAAFSGLRTAEILRLEFSDIDLSQKHIVVSAGKAKTASRRIVPIHDNLMAWLAPYARRKGKLWNGDASRFYQAQLDTAAATAEKANRKKGIKGRDPVKWKANACRHSYVSYRFAQTGDAGRVAGECGNSAAMVHKHYRALVTPQAAEQWFSICPEAAENVVELAGDRTLEGVA